MGSHLNQGIWGPEWLRGPATPRKRHPLIFPYRFELIRGARRREDGETSEHSRLHRGASSTCPGVKGRHLSKRIKNFLFFSL